MSLDVKALERLEELRRMHSNSVKNGQDSVEIGRRSFSASSFRRRVIFITFSLPVDIVISEPDDVGTCKVTCTLRKEHLMSAFSSLDNEFDMLWFGWPGIITDNVHKQAYIFSEVGKLNMIPVFLTQEELEHGYYGFCRKILWPLLHYLSYATIFHDDEWAAYNKMNKTFFESIKNCARASDIFIVNDYELMLLPMMLREKFGDSPIGFFMHASFPAQEMYQVLPWRKEILNGILASDLIGFFLYSSLHHFLGAVYHLFGYDNVLGRVSVEDHEFLVEVFPIGIDYDFFVAKEDAATPSIEDVTHQSSARFDRLHSSHIRILLAIEHMSNTRGLPHTVSIYESFLTAYPEFQGHVTLVFVVIPRPGGREPHDEELRAEINSCVTRVNGSLGTLTWTPILYMHRSFNRAERRQLYRVSDVALLATFMCSMNEFALEYLAARAIMESGVLVLSEITGSALLLTDTLQINPFDVDMSVFQLKRAFDMPIVEQGERIKRMQESLSKYRADVWASNFIYHLLEVSDQNRTSKANLFIGSHLLSLLQDFADAASRLIILSYDGTLVGFTRNPALAKPDPELLHVLKVLGSDPKTQVILNTGRDRFTLQKWFQDIPVDLVAEHGIWIRKNGEWQQQFDLSNTWKSEVVAIIQSIVDRTPGSFIEEKEHSVAWHYRNVDLDLGLQRVREVKDMLQQMTANTDLQVIESSKVIDVKASGFHKGRSVIPWLNSRNWDLILAIGNSPSDEDTFRVLPERAYDIKVGPSRTQASFYLLTYQHVRPVLRDLAARCQPLKTT